MSSGTERERALHLISENRCSRPAIDKVLDKVLGKVEKEFGAFN
jgi:hypothetical protein